MASRISSRSWSICNAVVTLQRSLPRSGAPLPHSNATCWPSCTTPRSRKLLITASMSSPGRSPMPATINARAAISRNSWPSSTARRLKFTVEQWQGRAIGGLVALFRRRCGRDLIRPQHAAMPIGRRRGLLAPHREIAFLFEALRRLCFCLPGFSRPGLQQGNLLLGGDRVPIDALAPPRTRAPHPALRSSAC